MAAISVDVPEEEQLIDAEDPEALALAQEDDSVHIRGSAGSAVSRSWRFGLCAVGILCAVALLAQTRESTPKASLLKTKDVHGITVLAGGDSGMLKSMMNKMSGGVTAKMETYYDDAKAKLLSVVPGVMGGTLGETTTTTMPYGAVPYYGTTLYPGQVPPLGVAPPLGAYPGTTIMPDGRAYALAPPTTMMPATTIINGMPYLAPPVVAHGNSTISVAPAAALPPLGQYPGPQSKSAATTQPPISVTQDPQPTVNQTSAVGASVSTVQKDTNVTPQDLNAQAATNPYGVQPCPTTGVTAAGTPCTPLKTYPYPQAYAGYTVTTTLVSAPAAMQTTR